MLLAAEASARSEATGLRTALTAEERHVQTITADNAALRINEQTAKAEVQVTASAVQGRDKEVNDMQHRIDQLQQHARMQEGTVAQLREQANAQRNELDQTKTAANAATVAAHASVRGLNEKIENVEACARSEIGQQESVIQNLRASEGQLALQRQKERE